MVMSGATRGGFFLGNSPIAALVLHLFIHLAFYCSPRGHFPLGPRLGIILFYRGERNISHLPFTLGPQPNQDLWQKKRPSFRLSKCSSLKCSFIPKNDSTFFSDKAGFSSRNLWPSRNRNWLRLKCLSQRDVNDPYLPKLVKILGFDVLLNACWRSKFAQL